VSISRYGNIAPDTLANAYQAIADSADKDPSLLSAPGIIIKFFQALSWHQLFPDIGQIILSLAWIACLAIVSLPAFVKFLPLRDQRYRDTTIRPYLAQFVPEERPPDPLTMDDDSITKFAKKFAHNSFWPVGNGKATILFTLAHSVLLFILVPLPLLSWGLVLFNLSLLVILAVLLTQATFLLFRQALRFVDERLIDVKGEG
jgi:hypothetical protein